VNIKAAHLVSLAFILLAGTLAAEDVRLPSDLRRLEKELSLASAKEMYIIMDIGSGVMRLKMKGVVLREWKPIVFRTWGVIATDEPLSVLEKRAITLPQREKIQPGDTIRSGDTFDLQALELRDMPTTFTFDLEKSIYIHVSPKPMKFSSRVKSWGYEFRWYVLQPIRTIYGTLKKTPFSMCDLVFESEKEPQALFWAVNQGTKFFIVPASGGSQ
jgi:hypothetical protein